MMNSAFAFGDDATIGLVMGGSGTPIPGTEWVDATNDLYINPLTTHYLPYLDTTYPGTLANGQVTPEGLYPLSAVGQLKLLYSSRARMTSSTKWSDGEPNPDLSRATARFYRSPGLW